MEESFLLLHPRRKKSFWRSPLFHALLFVITLLCTTFSGAEWMSGQSIHDLTWNQILEGLYFSIPFLAILTAHEFGHYFTAKYYRVNVSLPYYIPLWLFGMGVSIGTMGAFIQIRSAIRSRKEFFDIGYSGPWAGFFVAVVIIAYGFFNLPPVDYIFKIHPEYQVYGERYADFVYKTIPEEMNIRLGTNLLFEIFKAIAPEPEKIPNPYEMMHYPFLFSGFLACFFTALNLLPIGQLDGGHILYGLVGYRKHKIISTAFFFLLIFFGGLGLFSAQEANQDLTNFLTYAPLYVFVLYFIIERVFESKVYVLIAALGIFTLQFTVKTFIPTADGFVGWLVFAGIIGRMLGVAHPPATYDAPLDTKRKIIGWLSMVLFILCFSPTPLVAL
ncbi:MAG: site-2 protease family protein [Flammeovirgaceae bacterium]|nr:site-2 protease family protein [Flammeovirgaceae bacterium]MDW8287498.1 site-2 protease family protein [Flammeovirgaceae bacterium]